MSAAARPFAASIEHADLFRLELSYTTSFQSTCSSRMELPEHSINVRERLQLIEDAVQQLFDTLARSPIHSLMGSSIVNTGCGQRTTDHQRHLLPRAAFDESSAKRKRQRSAQQLALVAAVIRLRSSLTRIVIESEDALAITMRACFGPRGGDSNH